MSVRKIIQLPGNPIAPFGGNTIGVDPDEAEAAAAAAVVSKANVVAAADNEANTFNTSGTTNWVGATGANFSARTTHADWTLTAGGCIYTYTGAAPKQFLATFLFTGNPLANAFIYHEGTVGIDHNGDIIGTNGVNSFVAGMSQIFWPSGDIGYKSLVSSRVLNVSNGQTVRPVFVIETTGPNTNVGIIRLTFILTEVGEL